MREVGLGRTQIVCGMFQFEVLKYKVQAENESKSTASTESINTDTWLLLGGGCNVRAVE